ncbi:MAG: thymidylate kinase [Planctomycetaceae bacterium]|nr:thymidylate kinase [Planctomycetaceae bacterium]
MAFLVAIEGIDGSGKGTQANRLVAALRDAGVQTETMQFPRYAATNFGRAIGDFLNGRFGQLGDVHPQLAAVLYAGDRFESRSALEQMMATNDVVVLDRYVGSNLAHQAAKLDGEERSQLIDWIERVEFDVFGLPKANANILIDMSSDWSRELVSRKAARDYTDREADLQEADTSYMERVRGCYQQIAAGRPDWHVVPGLSQSGELRQINEVGDQILQMVMQLNQPN